MDFLYLALNVLTLLSVWLIVITVFRPPTGEDYEDVFRSPIDYSDRDTIFDMDIMRPILWPMLQLTRWVHTPGLKRRIQRHLYALGNPKLYSPDEYVVICMLWGVICAVGASVLYWLVMAETASAMLLIGAVIGAGGAYLSLRERALRRLQKISRRITYALDLIAMTMEAGATFYEATKAIIASNEDDPLNQEFAIMIREMDFGRSRREALEHLAFRIPVDGLESIISAVLQAEELGTPLAQVLRLQSNLLKMRRSMRAERRAGEAAVKLLIPSTLILISVVLVIFGPFIVRAIKGELY
ncbi:MAG: type II secretion system F family protein [Phycisphaerae bacterium]|nr:type II secretion system F family protein [Phycisphaerae bacterium]